MNQACGSPDDFSFGPSINSCHRGFDFTLFFEDTVLSLVPSAVFIPVACVLIAILARKKPVALPTNLYGIKIATYLALIATYCIVLATVARSHATVTAAGIPAAALALVSSILLAVVASLEHTRALAASPAPVFFVLCTALLDAARVRTLFLKNEMLPAVSLTVGISLKLLLLVLEGQSKENHLAVPSAEAAPEKLASPVSRTVFHWVNPLLLLGFKGSFKGRSLGPIDPKFHAAYLTERFAPIPQRVQAGLKKGRLSYLALRCVGHDLFCPVLPRLFVSLFSFLQPFLIDAMLNWLTKKDDEAADQGYGLIAATFFVYFGIAASYSWYWHQVNRSVTMIRGGLVIVLFDKLLRLPENPAVEAQAVTLMFSDTQRVMTAMNYFHELWAGVLDTAIATWLLYRKTGVASFAMLAVTIVSSIACTSLSKKLSGMQQKWLKAVEQRLGPTKRMVSSLKAIKMLSANERVASLLSTLRRDELAVAWPFRRLRIVTTAISYSTITLSPPLVFGVFIAIASGDGLDVSRLFTSLSLINLLATPVMHLCQAIPTLGAAHGCMARIQAFLEREEQSDKRTTLAPSPHDRPAAADDVILSLKDASFGWLSAKPILQGISLDVKRGSRVAILGRVGSGKTLLLKGLLGEAAEMSGEVAVGEHVSFAYCSQTPWLENASAEENWTGCGRGTSKSRAILDLLAQKYALEDIQNLHDYKTGTIGSQGVKLSGGQRQRLALARAASLDKDILLLDDVFSALDRRTKLHIAENVLQTRDSADQRTVIFTTHDEHIANMADEVYEINATGRLVRRSKIEAPPPQEIEATDKSGSSVEANKEEASTSDTNEDISPSSSTTSPAAEPAFKDRDVYKMYLRSMGLGNAIIFVLLGCLFAVSFKFPDIWIQWWSNDTSGTSRKHSTGYWIGLYAGLECIPLILLALWLRHVFYVIVPAVGISIHDRLLTTVLHAPFSHISAVDSGSIINRFNQDLMLIDSLLPFDLFNTIFELYVAVIQIILIAVASAQALAALPAVAGVLYMIQNFYLRTAKQLRILELEAKAILHSLVADVAAGAGPSTLRAHGWQPHLRRSFMKGLDLSQEPIYLLFCVQRWLQLVLNFVVMGLVVLVAGVAVALRTKVSAGAVGVAFLNATTLGETLTQFVLAYTSLETSLGAIARTAIFSATTPSEVDDNEEGSSSSWWPADGSVQLNNLWARYQHQQPESCSSCPNAAWSLRGITIDIPPGQKVSICGRTGSGKSTFILALLRMVELPIGTVHIGGRDHAQLSLAALRRGFLVVSQDALDESATATLREQIDPERQFTDEQVLAVVEDCGLQSLVEANGGLHARVAGGQQLSNGEAQFVSLARVLLYGSAMDGGILLLDEATSSLDEEAQRKMETLIEDKFRNKTIISVCHRLSWALRSDRIIVLEKGEVVHDGSPRDIVRESALFAGMPLSDSE